MTQEPLEGERRANDRVRVTSGAVSPSRKPGWTQGQKGEKLLADGCQQQRHFP